MRAGPAGADGADRADEPAPGQLKPVEPTTVEPTTVDALTRDLDSITPWVRWWLRAEGISGFLLGAFCWFALRGPGD